VAALCYTFSVRNREKGSIMSELLTLSLSDIVTDPTMIVPAIIVAALAYGVSRAARGLSDADGAE
jgi:hypothetical protein